MSIPSTATLKGFTLVELLIVITISSMAVALVGGIGVQEFKKYQVKAEQLELTSLLNQISHKAFIYEMPMQLKFKNSEVLVKAENNKKIEQISFQYIRFADTSLSVNKQGFYSQKQP